MFVNNLCITMVKVRIILAVVYNFIENNVALDFLIYSIIYILGNKIRCILLNCPVWEHDVVDAGVQYWVAIVFTDGLTIPTCSPSYHYGILNVLSILRK